MPKAKATLDGVEIAVSDKTVIVEGNHYFPVEDIHMDLLTPHEGLETICHWKGTASYFDIAVNDKKYDGVAFEYKTPSPEAAEIKGRVAFWRDVEVHEG